jgi:hypothetical protein
MTVRDESEILVRNLRYHHYLGIERCFVYLDGTTDDTADRIGHLPFVSIRNSVSREAYASSPEARFLIDNYDRIYTARQGLNTFDALRSCVDEGIDWLLHVDADEMVCVNRQDSRPHELRRFLDRIPSWVHVVQFRAYESLPRHETETETFGLGTLFGVPTTEYGRRLYDPYAEEYFEVHNPNGFLGHDAGKQLVRVSLNPTFVSSHAFSYPNKQSIPVTRQLTFPYLLHFYAYNFASFISKFQNIPDHPDTFLSGRSVPRTKRLLRDLVNDTEWSEEMLRQYYHEHIAYGREEIERRMSGTDRSVVKITAIERALRRLEQNSPDTEIEATGDVEREWHDRIELAESIRSRSASYLRQYAPGLLRYLGPFRSTKGVD